MAGRYTLLRSQRRPVFEVLREVGLEPADFSWLQSEKLGGSIIVSRLAYRERTYYFQFSWYELSSWCVLCTGRYRSMEYEHPMNWKEQEASFVAWAQCLRRELESPDPWENLTRYSLAIGVEPSEMIVNEPIPACQADEIAEGLTRLADRIEKELRPDAREMEMVHMKLGYLAEAARRQRSRDWVYTALGVCITMAMGLSQPPAKAAALWQLVKTEIGRYIALPTTESAPRTTILV
jgi:hypothetical protein